LKKLSLSLSQPQLHLSENSIVPTFGCGVEECGNPKVFGRPFVCFDCGWIGCGGEEMGLPGVEEDEEDEGFGRKKGQGHIGKHGEVQGHGFCESSF
jgi:hypothetical protein